MLSYKEQSQITQGVMLGRPLPQNESAEAKAFRASVERDVAKAREQGYMIDIPFDLDESPEEPGESASR